MDANGVLSGVGRAHRVAVATVQDDAVSEWNETEVNWDASHDEMNEGLRHATIAKYLQSRGGSALVAAGAGPDMRRMLGRMGIQLVVASGPARAAVEALASRSELPLTSSK